MFGAAVPLALSQLHPSPQIYKQTFVIIVSALLRLHKTTQGYTVMYCALHKRLVDPQTLHYNQIKEAEIGRACNTQRREKICDAFGRIPER
jgi:hypothetical protein